MNRTFLRISVAITAILVMVFLYLFQRVNFLEVITFYKLGSVHPHAVFAFNKTFRLIINDICCLALIWAIFLHVKYQKMAMLLFLIELLFILPLYLLVKLSLEGDSEISSPLLSQIHRLIVNPVLMFLLILGFFYQRHYISGARHKPSE